MQGSGLPRGRETEVIVAVVIPAVTDTEPVRTEVADADAAPIRVLVDASHPGMRHQPSAGCKRGDDEEQRDGADGGDFLICFQEHGLLGEGLVAGTFHRDTETAHY